VSSIAKRVTGHQNERTLQPYYQRANNDQVRRAVEVMPNIPLRATGTEDPQACAQH